MAEEAASRWARLPAGILLIIGGCLAILPVFGLWMFPLGLMLLADDIPPLRRFRDRVLDWLERRRPNWFAAAGRAPEPRTPSYLGVLGRAKRLTSGRF